MRTQLEILTAIADQKQLYEKVVVWVRHGERSTATAIATAMAKTTESVYLCDPDKT